MTVKIEHFDTRLHFLDGLRGWASLVVLFSHLFQCWLIYCLNGEALGIYLTYVRHSPFFLFVDGYTAVHLFFVISAMALSYKFFTDGDVNGIIKIAKFRYFRLAIPIFFSSLFAYGLLNFGFMHHHEIGNNWLHEFYNFEPNFINLLKDSFFNTFFSFKTPQSYNAILWTMSIELIGSFLIFLFLYLFGRSKVRIFIYFLFFCLFQKNYFPIDYLCFLTGVIISDCYCNFSTNKLKKYKLNYLIVTSLFLIFLFCFTQYVALIFNSFQASLVSAALLVIMILNSSFLQRIFSCTISRFMGRISFSLYLIHLPILCSFTSIIYLRLSTSSISPFAFPIAVFFLTLFVCIATAYIFAILVEEKFLKKFKNRFNLFDCYLQEKLRYYFFEKAVV